MLKIYLLLFSALTFAQDERFIREFFAKYKSPQFDNNKFVSDISVKGKTYFYDLDEDGVNEGIQKELKNGIIHLHIFDSYKQIVKTIKFDSVGVDPDIYKIKLNRISKDMLLLSFYVYDGYTQGHEFYGATTVYFASYKEKDISNMKLTKGPRVWLEKETKSSYIQRIHQIELYDYDEDGVKEAIISKTGTPIRRVINF